VAGAGPARDEELAVHLITLVALNLGTLIARWRSSSDLLAAASRGADQPININDLPLIEASSWCSPW